LKKFLLILVALLTIGYLLFSAVYFRSLARSKLCEAFEVVIEDSSRTQFVRTSDIERLVKRYDLYPVGKSFGEINTLAIRDTILGNQLVESAEVYTTPGGGIVAAIRQRKPVLRVISDHDGSFYVDQERRIMPVSTAFTVYVPVATGAVTETLAQGVLYDFAMFLNRNADWDAWIEQIEVRDNGDAVLIPRAGDFTIVMGSLEDYPVKLSKFARFVDEGLNVVGWNRYSEINLKYENQVVCTRK
jgi:cell division protein FtsQ